MDDEMLKLTEQVMNAFNEGGVGAIRDFLHDDIEFREPPEQPGPRVFHGKDEMVEAFSRWSEAWEEQRSEGQEMIELGGERFLYLSIEHFKGRDGLEVEQACGTIFGLKDGKIVHIESYWDQDTARSAAGLS